MSQYSTTSASFNPFILPPHCGNPKHEARNPHAQTLSRKRPLPRRAPCFSKADCHQNRLLLRLARQTPTFQTLQGLGFEIKLRVLNADRKDGRAAICDPPGLASLRELSRFRRNFVKSSETAKRCQFFISLQRLAVGVQFFKWR